MPDFPVYDGLLHTDKPYPIDLGLTRIHSIYGQYFFPPGADQTGPADEAVTRAALRALPGDPHRGLFFSDIESWPLKGDELQQSIGYFLDVISWIRSERPGLTIGNYDMVPLREYWAVIQGGHAYRAWRNDNTRLWKLARAFDVLFPSIYTFYDLTVHNHDQGWDNWLKYAGANLAEARRLTRGPVIPFLWYRYHGSNAELGGQEIPAGYWRRQLEFCRKHADGIVLWGGWNVQENAREVWDTEAVWWQETIDFLVD